MFKTIKNWFKTIEAQNEEKGINMKALIVPTTTGFTLREQATGATIGTYTRKRDAVRGATRRGLVILQQA